MTSKPVRSRAVGALNGLPASSRAALIGKLSAPSVTGHEIERASIRSRVLGANSARLVLLRAPAGFGKTTAMLELRRHMEAAGTPTAWLTLDRADNDVGRFLGMLAAALAPIVQGLDAARAATGVSRRDGPRADGPVSCAPLAAYLVSRRLRGPAEPVRARLSAGIDPTPGKREAASFLARAASPSSDSAGCGAAGGWSKSSPSCCASRSKRPSTTCCEDADWI